MMSIIIIVHNYNDLIVGPYLAFCTMVCVDISGLQHAEASLSMFIVGRGVGSVVLHALAGSFAPGMINRGCMGVSIGMCA